MPTDLRARGVKGGGTRMQSQRPAIVGQICSIIADVMEIDVVSVGPDANIYTELGVDSLAILSVFVGIKRIFGVPEPENASEFPALHSARLIAEYVLRHSAGGIAQ